MRRHASFGLLGLGVFALLSGCEGGPTSTGSGPDGPPVPPAASVEVNALLYSGLALISPGSDERSWEIVLQNQANNIGGLGITEHPASDTEPTGSLDGSTLAFQTDRDGNWEIYCAENVAAVVVDFSPPTLRRLTDHPAQDIQPALSPDGSQIAFVSDREGGYDIYIQGLDAIDPPAKITDVGSATDPAWSPNGLRIVFTARAQDTGKLDIYVADVDGTDLTRLTASSSSSETPAWSPDGQRIAFQRAWSIWTMNSDGTDQTPFYRHPSAKLAQPVWAGDGQHIYFELDCISECIDPPLGPGVYFKKLGDGAGAKRVDPSIVGGRQPAWLGSP